MQVEVIDLIKEYFSQNAREIIQAKLDEQFKSGKEDITQSIRQSLMVKIEETFKDDITETIDKFTGGIAQKVKRTEEIIETLRQQGMPEYYIDQINRLNNRINEMDNSLKQTQTKLRQLNELLVDPVSNEELRALYLKSGLQLKHISDRFKIEMPSASRWVNGNIDNYAKRNELKNYLQEEISKNEARNK
jgi:hypothetical protein